MHTACTEYAVLTKLSKFIDTTTLMAMAPLQHSDQILADDPVLI